MNSKYRWLTEMSQVFLERDYLVDGQTVDQRVDEICNTAEKLLNKPGFAAKFKENFQKGWYSLSTPIWTNFGNERGMPISCFGSSISDSMQSIAYTWAEVAMMTKYGGGTSATFGNLRPRGASIRDNGESSGAVHFMQAFENLIQIVSQGSCYIEGTEVLTNNGFKDFREVLTTDKLAQLDEFNNVSFTEKYEMVVNDFEGNLICLSGKKTEDSVSIKVTPNHRMVVCRRKMQDRERYWPSNTEIVEAQNLNLHRDNRIPLAGWAGKGDGLSNFDRLRIAYQADGRKDDANRKIRFHFSKERKVQRLEKILNDMKIKYEKKTNPDKTISINFEYEESIKKKTFSEWVKIENINGIWAQEFIEELSCWDGNVSHGGCVTYSSIDKTNIDIVQAIAALADLKTRVRIRPAYGNRRDLHCINISENAYRGGESINKTEEYYKGKVYCAIVPEGRLLVRYQDRVMVCGNTRRGNFAAYLPIDHADIMEFLQIRTEGFAIQDLSYGVCVPDYWMEEMINGDADKRKVWAKVLEMRANFGYPYITFIDNANNNTVDCYKDKGMKITHSNLCNEILLCDNEDESFVCDLSSMNILHYDEWKDTDAVELLVYLLDAVMTEFIEKAKKIKFMERAVKFAERHRALGVGWLGWHSYLQSKMIPWESMEAKFHNTQIAKNIKEAAYKASAKLAEEYGEPEVCKGYGRRNTTLLAIAPTKSCTAPDTKFKDSNLDNIDYFEFTRRGGLDLHEIMSIECELDNGQKVKYRYDEIITVKRNGEEISIKACEIAENDIL